MAEVYQISSTDIFVSVSAGLCRLTWPGQGKAPMSSNTAAASDGASSAGQDDASWKDWEASGDEEVQPAAQSLFETKYFQTVEEALQHDIKTFDFDLVDFIVKVSLKGGHRID